MISHGLFKSRLVFFFCFFLIYRILLFSGINREAEEVQFKIKRPFSKMAANYKFFSVSIKISLTNLVFELLIQKNF